MTVQMAGGLDLSMVGTGVAHTQVDGTACTHLITPKLKGDHRLVEIRDQVLSHVQGSELVLIENWVKSLSLAITAMVQGAVRSGLVANGIRYGTVPPTTLKKYATGSGGGDKSNMAVAAYKRGGVEFKDNNQCDAWWLWVMCRDLLGDPVFPLPKVQRDCLAKVKLEA